MREAVVTKRIKRRVPLFTRGECHGRRLKENVSPPLLVILDFDKVTKPLEWAAKRFEFYGVDHFGYTTHSHGELEGVHSYRIITDHVASTWGELRDICEQLSEIVDGLPAPESWTSPGWFIPAVHPDRVDLFMWTEHLTGGSTWFPKRRNADVYDAPRPKRERTRNESFNYAEVESALAAIPNEDEHYDDWLEIGMALHETGAEEALDLWKEWSEKSSKHDADYCDQKWETFHEDRDTRVTLGTIFHHAQAHGWEGHADQTPTAAQDFEDYVRERDRSQEDDEDEDDEEPEDLKRWRSQLDGVTERQAIALLNTRFAHVLKLGAVVDTAGTELVFHKPAHFKDSFIHPMFSHPTKKDKDGNPILESLGKLWFNSKRRRSFESIDFLPPGGPQRLRPDVFNLWRGWGVEPEVGERHRYLIDHVFENVCAGNEEWGRWVVAWMAHLVQRPWEKVGTALVLRSNEEGTGKGVLGHSILKLAGEHGVKIDHVDRLTGRFNAHLYGKVFVFADEVTWGGNHKDAGFLRSLVTEEVTGYEEKNVPSFKAQSFSRLFLTGNDRWLVPAGPTARRWQVFDVSDAHMQDRPYFGRIVNNLRRGGYGHLLHYLQEEVDLDEHPDPRSIITTTALVNQKTESLDDFDRWLYDALWNGYFKMPHSDQLTESEWPQEVPKEDLFLSFKTSTGGRFLHKRDQTMVGQRLSAIFGSALKDRRIRNGHARVRIYEFPNLERARKLFEQRVIFGTIAWPSW